ncbi:Hypothetical protein (Fragment), partial [Durusdinium trenchii]
DSVQRLAAALDAAAMAGMPDEDEAVADAWYLLQDLKAAESQKIPEVEGLREVFAEARLPQRVDEAMTWCQSQRLLSTSEVVSAAQALGDHLNLRPLERKRLNKALEALGSFGEALQDAQEVLPTLQALKALQVLVAEPKVQAKELEQAIEKAKEAKVDEEDLANAKQKLEELHQVASAQQALEDAMRDGDIEVLEAALAEAKRLHVSELYQAEKKVETLKATQ